MKKNYLPLVVVLCLNLVTTATAQAGQMRNGLPPTTMDSFVFEAKEYAESIYGDEGTYEQPPYYGFEQANRINTGIADIRNRGLTTGHGSYMPSAWGRDEFLGQEMSLSGQTGRTAAIPFQDGRPNIWAPPTVQAVDNSAPFAGFFNPGRPIGTSGWSGYDDQPLGTDDYPWDDPNSGQTTSTGTDPSVTPVTNQPTSPDPNAPTDPNDDDKR